ncbi:hypothetical protein M513_10031 [Trichuris suis]|uniref:Uncharacterized protein n=1 Tax=Trichuris suis TaxID=68888 RepID=A0A085LVU3_9BILA|nr:hypothetical protein M513_10031 [Trichuris suis]
MGRQSEGTKGNGPQWLEQKAAESDGASTIWNGRATKIRHNRRTAIMGRQSEGTKGNGPQWLEQKAAESDGASTIWNGRATKIRHNRMK